MKNKRQYIEIIGANPEKKLKIAYLDSKIGNRVILFVHGFGASATAWKSIIPLMPENYRSISVDLKGFGYSDMSDRDNLTTIEQAVVLSNFILALKLKDLVLVGHSMGGATSLLALFKPEIQDRVQKLILIDSGGIFKDIPDFIKEIAIYNEDNPLVRFINEDIFSYIFLRKMFANERKISSDLTNSYANVVKQEGAKECLIEAARQLTLSNIPVFLSKIRKISIPTLIIWGGEDQIIDIEDAYTFNENIQNSTLKIIQDCGHCPQEEKPVETGHIINEFLHEDKVTVLAEGKKVQHIDTEKITKTRKRLEKKLRPKLTKMVERWSIGTLIILIFMKTIQFLRKLGLKANENGWRKASGVFLKKEQSKFILGVFHLRYYRENQQPPFDLLSAKTMFISRISEFLRKKTSLHWAIQPGFFSLGRRKSVFTDIIEIAFNHEGEIIYLQPHFDKARSSFPALTQENIQALLDEFVSSYNKLIRKKSKVVAEKLSRRLKTWLISNLRLGFNARFDMLELIDRMLTASYINFEILPADEIEANKRRFATPNIKICRHPGFGLLNMIVRFSADFKSSDLWVQYHHVPVDGLPMQELLEELKKSWGATQQLVYPAPKDIRPEIFYIGNRVFRARMFGDFSKFLNIRHKLNHLYKEQMNGPATIASMIMWGLCNHPFFKESKILFPVDIEKGVKYASERELSLLFIRPATYFDKQDPLKGFITYEREFNRRLSRTRIGTSESYEMLELYSIVHPIFYYLAKNLMPRALSEYVGTVGLSLMKNAEMFIAPLSDLQSNGFMAIGNMVVPTIDGKSAGAVSICGSRTQIKAYLEAMDNVVEKFDEFLNL